MATAKTARALIPRCSPSIPRSAPRPQSFLPAQQQQQRRAFFPNPLSSDSSTPEVLSATRTVPYPASTVYAIISDISSYSTFIPFCTSSTVTKHSSPDSKGRKWPEQATLTVGFTGDIAESFESRVYCVPDRVVEAVSGPAAETELPEAEVQHHTTRPAADADPTRKATVLSHLRTRWELRPFPFRPHTGGKSLPAHEQTEVMLRIEYAFANPLYGIMSKAAAPKIAERIIAAFERRIGDVVHKPSTTSQTEVLRS